MAGDKYTKFKVAELKELVKERGIAGTGLTRKQQYIDALEAHDAQAADDAADAATGGDDERGAGIAESERNGDGEVGDDGHHAGAVEADAEVEGATAGAGIADATRKRKRPSATPSVQEADVSKKLKTANEPPSETLPPPDTARAAPGDSGVSAAIHPPTPALYIRDLIRPLQAHQLHSHLADLATAPGDPADQSVIDTCHLDTLRTHAFAIFTSATAASRARSQLHDTVWPDEPTRKSLWVDFVPPDKAREWIELEQADGRDRRHAKRWEVVYDTDASSGHVAASLQEVKQGPQPAVRTQPSQLNAPLATKPLDAPTGPRADRLPSTYQDEAPRPSDTMPPPTRRTSSPLATRNPPKQSTETFNILNQRFNSTTAKPKLYFQPVSAELAEDRLRELEQTTSRDWIEERRTPQGGVDGQLRRYTFEDGDKLVDGGPDRGSFGVPEGYFRGGGGGRGRRGRGRW
ncbi:hypothetical protein EJ03DRAFT_376891 [Teratosphaeria nubilosa]|uniref:SAP domain-containing protein n=1 Tax=Teratosphaeria nubilosa TaxID=161662 RepID=A0A6G1L200_9PEZI|nr:hypothetical protein EJ03DRAFT_376891 [Teratosphaeria nubilosa]